MSEQERLFNEYQKKLKELQDSCPHLEKSEWMDYQWAMAHSTGQAAKCCKRCGKILEMKSWNEIPVRLRPSWMQDKTKVTILSKKKFSGSGRETKP